MLENAPSRQTPVPATTPAIPIPSLSAIESETARSRRIMNMLDMENGVATLAGAGGCEVRYTDDAPPWITRPALERIEDVNQL